MRAVVRQILIGWLAVAVVCGAGMAGAAETTCNVKYLSAEHVYLDAGLNRGLAVGLTGRVVRDGKAIGELEVVFTAETSASCTVVSRTTDFVAGDAVVFEVVEPAPVIETPLPEPTPRRVRTTTGSSSARPRVSPPQVRGHVAVQWDHAVESNDRDLQTDIIRLPFRLQARDVWRGYSFYTRGSLRRLERKGFSGNTPSGEWRNRIQELALVRDGREQAWHVAFGRIGGRVTNTAGPFDGLSLSRRLSTNARAGLFGGFAPQWGDLGFGTDDHLVGANFQLNQRSPGGRMLDLVLAAIGRYRSGEISREYVTMTTTWRGTRGLSLLQAAEVDFNRGWRRDAGARTVVLSSLALSGRYEFSRRVSADLGFDNREPVRTWETRSLPDSLFADAGRKGWRGGLRWRPSRHFSANFSGTLRKEDRGGGNITGWNLRVNAPGLLADRLTLFGGIRAFDGPWLSGWSPSVGASKYTRSGYRLRAEGGYYNYTGSIDDTSRDNTWLMLAVDKDLTSRLSAAVEYRQDWGDDIVGRRWFVELRHRF